MKFWLTKPPLHPVVSTVTIAEFTYPAAEAYASQTYGGRAMVYIPAALVVAEYPKKVVPVGANQTTALGTGAPVSRFVTLPWTVHNETGVQEGNLKNPNRVCQQAVVEQPVGFDVVKYSWMGQKVHSSVGSMLIML
ncbi:hypothetical protein HRbin11_02330 [bacterium HR11]|nr:hypothetical protein HRbin11_02330 [bacterium HR11]